MRDNRVRLSTHAAHQAEPLRRLQGALRVPRAGSGVDVRYGAALAGVAGLYIAAAKLGLALSVAHGVITPVWAPTGIALASLLLLGRRFWPAIAFGALVANATSGASIAEAAGISVGNTLEAVVGATLLLRVGFRPALDRVRDVLALVLLGAVASTAISATNGVTTLLLSGDVSRSSYASEWLLWWVGDAMGDLIVAPLLLVWATVPLRKSTRARAVEALLLATLLVGVSLLVFLAGAWRYPHLVFPLLIWATLRFRQRGAVTSSFVVAAIAVAGGVTGTTPLGSGSATEIVQILEGLLAAVTLSLLILGAVLTERTTAEEGVERAHASLAEAQAVAHIGSWEWDLASNRVTWSDELYRLFGLEPQSVELTYDGFIERVHPDDREPVSEAIERAYAERAPFDIDHRIVLESGQVTWLHARGRVISGDDGIPVRMLGTSQDVTERRRLDELRDTILSTVSHELRTPLTSILGFSMTLQARDGSLSAARRVEIVSHLAEQARRLDRLLTDLLDLERLRQGFVGPAFRPTDVGRLVRQLVADVISDAPETRRPIELDADSAVAEVDAPKVERIVENLLVNAFKHTPPHTPVRIRVENADHGVLISVDDKGPGIAEEEREAIFEIFNRGNGHVARPAGTGIGLALVAQFTALHGGRAWVEPNAGGGSAFRVFLPAQQAP